MGALDELRKKTGAGAATGNISGAKQSLVSVWDSRKPTTPATPTAPPKTPLMDMLTSDKARGETRQDITPPTPWERTKKVFSGAGKSTLGGTQNVFGVISRAVEQNIDQEPLVPFYESEIVRLNKLLEGNPNALKRKNIEADIKMYENLMAGKNPASEMAKSNLEGSATDIERAKEGAGKLGRLGVDVGVGALQLAGDIGVGALTGGGAMVPMALRSFGGSAYEAEMGGGTLGQQIAYGGLSAATAVLVEKISNAGKILNKAFGKGVADDVLEKGLNKAVSKIVKNPAVAGRLTSALAGFAGEGLEETIEATLSPLYQKITFDPDAKYDADTVSDVLYEGLVGGIIGGIAGGLGGGNTQSRQDIQSPQTVQQNTIAPNLQQNAQQAKQATQSPTIAQNVQEVKLPTEAQNAVEGTVEPVVAIRQKIATLQQKLEYEKAVNANYYSEYRMAEPDTLSSDFYAQARQQSQKVADAQAELDAAKQELTVLENQFAQEAEAIATADARRASEAELIRIAKEHDGRFVNESAISEMEKTGAMPEMVADIRKRFDAASKITRRLNKLYIDLGNTNSLQESIEINQKIEKAKVDLQKAAQKLTQAQEAIANYTEQATEQTPQTPQTQSTTAPAQINVQPTPIFPENSLGAKVTQQLPQGTGAASPQFAYQERVNQQHSTDTAFTEAERQMPGLRREDSTHQVITDKNAMAQAQERLAFDFEGEKADLSTKQDWDKADTTAAHLILRKLTDSARQTGDYSEVIKWNKTLETQKSAQGQALQANRQFANTPAAITADAAESLFGDKTKRLSNTKKAEIMDNVAKTAETLDAIPNGDTASVIEIIKKTSKLRGTEGVFSKDTSKSMSNALDYASKQPWGFDFLKDVAAGQVRSIATDYNKVGFWSGVKTIRFSNMLSSFATVMRNLGGNQTFDIGDSLSNNVAIPFDMILSKISGTRSVAFDKSWASKAKRAGSADGFIKSYIQVGLDVDVDNVQSKYETTPGRTFKMTGNPMERFLSTVQKWQGYALQSTDEFAKGGTAAEAQRGIDKLKSKGKIAPDALQDRATEIAKQRTFQDESTAAKAVIGTRSALNALHSTDSQGGTFGVGDLMIPFAQVPSNLATQAVNATPVGLAKSTVQFANAIAKARQGKLSADAQANIATNIGRGLTGTAGFAFFAGLAAKGILKIVGSDDKDKDALERAEGASGTQINVDALVRWTKGESTEWQSGDKLVNVGFLEHLNVQMAGGALLAQAYLEDGTINAKEIAKASAEAVFQTLLELPAISQIQDLVDGYKYSKAETDAGKAVDAAGTYLGSQVSRFFIPNLVAGAARGLDDKVRDQYAEEGIFPQAKADIFSKIPGLRQTLPVKLDPWGKERTTGDNALLNFVNATLSPAKVNEYQTNAINKELFRLDDAGENVKYPTRKMLTKISNGGIDFELNAKEQNAFHNTAHQLAYKYMDDAIKSGDYMAMSDSEKADYLTYMYSLAIDTAKRNYFEKKGVSYSSDFNKAVEVQEAGMQPSTYYHYKEALKIERPEGGTPSQVQISKAVNNLSLSSEEKGALWTIANGGESDKNPFTGTLAQAGLPADETIKIMEEYKTIASEMDDYVKAEGGPGKSQVQAAYFRQWLYNQGFNAAEVDYIEDVFTTWQMIPIEKPSKKALSYAATYPR